MVDATPLAVRDRIIQSAQSLPDLISKAELADPKLAESLTDKSLVGSKSIWMPPISWAVSAIVAHYGLGWSDASSATVASLLAWAAVVVIRYFTRAPIGSVLPVTAASPVANVAPKAAAMAVIVLSLVGLSACSGTPAVQQQQATAVAGALTTLGSVAAANSITVAGLASKGTLFCGQMALPNGILIQGGVIAAATVAGAPVSVINRSAQAVADTCRSLGLVAGVPPAGTDLSAVPVQPVPSTTLPPVV